MTTPNEPHAYDDLATAAIDSPDVVEARLSLVGQALEQAVQLGTFTDEELAALDGLTLTPVQPSPWYAGLTDAEKQIALAAALRGLTARGVYRAEPIDPSTKTFMPHVEPNILALITMRRYVPRLVIAERKTSDFTDWAVLYPQRAEVFLAEYVDRRGIHTFELADHDKTIVSLTSWCGAADLPAPALDVTLSQSEIEAKPESLRPVAEARIATVVTRFDPEAPGHEDWSGIYTGPDGSHLSLPDGATTRYLGADLDGVRAHWTEVLG